MTRDQIKSADALNILAGLWLIIAAFALGYADITRALWNDIILGVAIVAIAAVRVASERLPWLSWIELVLGAWLIAAPFVLGYADVSRPFVNDVIVGAIVVFLSGFSALAYRISSYPPGSA
jgi:hypothetical protein